MAVSGLVLNFLPDPSAADAAMRAAAPTGVVAAYVWDYAEKMELMRHFWDAAVALDPKGARRRRERSLPDLPTRPPGRALARRRTRGRTTRAIDEPIVFADFDDYWTPFLGGQGPAPAYAMSLDAPRRDALRDRIRAGLPVAADGSISLIARAWAVRGRSVQP